MKSKPIKFNARAFKLLPDGTNAAIDGYEGLRIIVSGALRTWTYRYRSPVDGKVKQTKLGGWPDMSFEEARGAWLKARNDRASGIDAAAEKKAKSKATAPATVEPGAYTVRALLTEYLTKLETVKKRSPSSLRSVTAMFKRLPDEITQADPLTITRKKAHDLIEKYSDRPALAIKLRSELAAAWNAAIKSGKFDDADGDTNPRAVSHWPDSMRGELKSDGHVRGGKRGGGEKTTDKRVLGDGEIKAVLAWLATQPKRMADVLTLTLATGARSGEIVQMRGDQLTVENRVLWWTLPKSLTKNAKVEIATDYRVPLIGRAEAIVAALRLEHKKGYLFPGSKGHISQNEIGEALNRRMPYDREPREGDAPVTGWTAHDLRRTARTKLAFLKCPHEVGEAILGHVLGGVAGTYNLHRYDAEKVEWLTTLAAELERLAA